MIWVAIRCHNDIKILGKTLEGLSRQTVPHQLLFLDNASEDGSAELGRKAAQKFLHIEKGAYRPGPVLNLAMRETDSDVVVFLNSDCPPLDEHCLQELLRPFEDPSVGATFGNQLPHLDCFPILARDTEETFGDGQRQKSWRHCFSMAISAVRRSAWQDRPFREDLQYSEDIDFSWALVQKGWRLGYAPSARVWHSHNYSLAQYARRQAGEGAAEARIFEWSPWQASALRYALLPALRSIWRDWRYCWQRSRYDWLLKAPLYRLYGSWARYRSFRKALAQP